MAHPPEGGRHRVTVVLRGGGSALAEGLCALYNFRNGGAEGATEPVSECRLLGGKRRRKGERILVSDRSQMDTASVESALQDEGGETRRNRDAQGELEKRETHLMARKANRGSRESIYQQEI